MLGVVVIVVDRDQIWWIFSHKRALIRACRQFPVACIYIRQSTPGQARFTLMADTQTSTLIGVGPRAADHTINLVPMSIWPSYDDIRRKSQWRDHPRSSEITQSGWPLGTIGSHGEERLDQSLSRPIAAINASGALKALAGV